MLYAKLHSRVNLYKQLIPVGTRDGQQVGTKADWLPLALLGQASPLSFQQVTALWPQTRGHFPCCAERGRGLGSSDALGSREEER